MEEIYYLKQQEKQRTRELYENSFPEDSTEFVDYYYEWKIKENEILVMGDQKLQVMIHLNFYDLWINGHVRNVPYLVAVATDPGCRRQGKMGRVMKQALQDLSKKSVPFTFLLPADPAYYTGQGFVFFPQQGSENRRRETGQPLLKAAEAGPGIFEAEGTGDSLEWKQARPEEFGKMAEFANQLLGKRYQIFVKRDVYYYQRLLAETRAEHGNVLLLKSEENIQGILVYGTEEAEKKGEKPIAEIKELLLASEPELEQKKALCEIALPGCAISFGESQMMARITDLASFLPILKSSERHSLCVKVRDDLISSNCGCYRMEIGEEGGRIERISEERGDRCQELTIAELAELLLDDTTVFLNEWV
ncbi:MAG: GNAT family N-acetyltransferase [Lachnospiraceae bacterium]|nr:GNAT family N-acetyltransferase [Lachnospiraceae bacterium]